MTEPMNPAEIAAMVAEYRARVEMFDLMTGPCVGLRKERGQTTRDFHAATADMLEALQAQLSAMTEARDAAVARVEVLVGMFDPYISPFSWESAADFHERVLGYNAKILAEGTPT